MKALICIVTLSGILHLATASEPTPVSAEVAKEVQSLLQEMPSQAALWRYRSEISADPPSADQAEVAYAREQVKKAHDIVPKVRKLLKVGASVFAYPGLLAHGDITYQIIKSDNTDPFASAPNHTPSEFGYRLYIGLPAGEFPHPFDFEVLFDSSGIIRAINGVDWKK